MLTEADQAWILNEAAIDLRALGRLREAVAPMRASLDACVGMKDWEAAIRASNLSELHLALGHVAEAVAMGEASVHHAERSGHASQRTVGRTAWADALHQAGEVERAQALFEEAEALQAQERPHEPRLYSLQGYQYCDLLLGHGPVAAVRERATQTLESS